MKKLLSATLILSLLFSLCNLQLVNADELVNETLQPAKDPEYDTNNEYIYAETEIFPEPENDNEDLNLMSASTVNTYSKSANGGTYLSKNFKVSEFACKDGSDTILIDAELVAILQNIRDYFGAAVTINSAYRTSTYNAKVGGASNSYHVKGMAADITVSGKTPAEIAKYAETIGVRGVGRYNSFVHVDSRPTKYYWRNSGSSNVTVSTHGGTYNANPYSSTNPDPQPQYYNPEGTVDGSAGGYGTISLTGWAFDRDDLSQSLGIHIYIGTECIATTVADKERTDVNAAFGVGNHHGFAITFNTDKIGTYDVDVYAINIGGGTNVKIGSKTVTITPRVSELKYWLSESDMGPEITECEKEKSYYLCYKIYDSNSGEQLNSYSNLSYTVKLTFYDANGTEIGSREFTKVDRASVQFTTVEVGTCSYKVTISGDLSGEVIQSFTIKETDPPVISDIQITDITENGYTITCMVTDYSSIEKVVFPVWSAYNGQDDILWGEGTLTGNKATYRVKTSEHNNEHGVYHAHIYATDIYDNTSSVMASSVFVPMTSNSSNEVIINNKKYILYDNESRLMWHEAKNFCEQQGGYLATITSLEEQKIIEKLIGTDNKTAYYLGATDEETENEWKWVTGEEWSYSNWNTGEPNNGGSVDDRENCLSVYSSSHGFKWVDITDNPVDHLGFICEVDLPYTQSAVTDYGTYKLCSPQLYNIQEPCKVIVSAYKDNRLVSCETKSFTDSNPFVLIGDIDEIKVMAWNDLSSLKPLCRAEVVPESNFIKSK